MIEAVTSTAPPFSGAIGIEPRGPGSRNGSGHYHAELGDRWVIGGKAHGGLLLVLLVRAGLAELAGDPGQGAELDPLAVSADFLRAPDPGPVEMSAEVVKRGRTASVVHVRMEQAGKAVLTASLTAGALPDGGPRWADLPDLPAEPPADAFDPGADGRSGVSSACDIRLDTSTMGFARGEAGDPVVRGWARPRAEPSSLLFALLASDALPPTVFNVGGTVGWAPTVQFHALLRADPAPGWLRLETRSTLVSDTWFDEEATVVDSAGRLVCQSRQLALAPKT